MLVTSGTFTGNGARRTITLAFAPKVVFIKGDQALHGMFHTPNQWCGRSVGMSNLESGNNLIRIVGNTIRLGTDAKVAASGVNFIWGALGEDTTDDLETQSWLGRGAIALPIALQKGFTPKAMFIKRDNALSGILRVSPLNGGAGRGLDGATLAGEPVTGVTSGLVTLAASVNNVNQYDSANGIGEGIDGVFVSSASTSCEVVAWTGTGSSGTVTIAMPNPKFAFIYRDDATQTNQARIAVVGTTLPMGATAAVANDAVLNSGNISFSTGFGGVSGVPFKAIVFGGVDGTPAEAPTIITSGKKAVYLPGRDIASVIDCGVSDATLNISGAMTVEWFGIPFVPGLSNKIGQLIGRGLGPIDTANGYSWASLLVATDETTTELFWPGGQYMVVPLPQIGIGKPLDTCAWRTGILGKYGAAQHVITTHDGAGGWKLIVNGVLVKQRVKPLATNIASVSGHRTGIGAWQNGSGWADPLRMAFIGARVYNRQLNLSEAATRFSIAALGSAAADVTTGLAEVWDASTASGTLLPAQVNTQNSGTIVNGQIVML
ncbi:hypothetical protein [Rhodoferax sp. WC2427]|uniref:hypothetical protein n=1 Tax=Rhodoferax sp. WC2427 TaxID=3234144 RepID=UPI00346693A2